MVAIGVPVIVVAAGGGGVGVEVDPDHSGSVGRGATLPVGSWYLEEADIYGVNVVKMKGKHKKSFRYAKANTYNEMHALTVSQLQYTRTMKAECG